MWICLRGLFTVQRIHMAVWIFHTLVWIIYEGIGLFFYQLFIFTTLHLQTLPFEGSNHFLLSIHFFHVFKGFVWFSSVLSPFWTSSSPISFLPSLSFPWMLYLIFGNNSSLLTPYFHVKELKNTLVKFGGSLKSFVRQLWIKPWPFSHGRRSTWLRGQSTQACGCIGWNLSNQWKHTAMWIPIVYFSSWNWFFYFFNCRNGS